MATHTSHYCEVCKVSCRSRHNLDQNMQSRKHRARVNAAARTCTVCQITVRRQVDLNTHFNGRKHKNKVLLMDISAATFANMDELYRKALAILGRVDATLPPLDLAHCHPYAITNRLKTLEIGHACISCFSDDFDSEFLVREHLHKDQSHIYPKCLLEAEKHQVLLLMADDPEGALKVKVVFALKKSLLVHVFP